MKTRIPPTTALFTALLATLLLLSSVAPALADRAGKKSTSYERSSSNTAIKALKAGTTEGAVEATLRALANRQTSTSKTSGKGAQATADTNVRRESKILFARATSDVFTTKIDLVDDEQQVELGIYNMLGKKSKMFTEVLQLAGHTNTQPQFRIFPKVCISAFCKAKTFAKQRNSSLADEV